ncbi:MAG: Xaa-Pro peptidase family protein [Fimbriimonadales bacterium]
MSDRISSLAQALQSAGADAFFAWSPVAMGYLHGFHEGGGERFLSLAVKATGEVAMICPALSATQAGRTGIADVRSWRDGEDPLALFGRLADEWHLKTGILALDDEMPAHMVLAMQEALPAALFKAGGPLLAGIMRVKQSGELDLMRRAARIADDALAAGLAAIRPGATEREVSEALSTAMSKAGGKPTFSIVAAGKNGAEPHHMTDETRIERGDVVILDFGCDVGGYQSDITRTVACGEVSDEAKKVYEIVYAAQAAGRAAIQPGVAAGEIDRVTREVIEAAGFGEYFMHRTGHGIGMKGHEEPFIVGGNPMPLEPGHCFSVEPGIYLPGRFGVRIENIVTVTQEGHESLNDEPRPSIQVISN